jgi:predicted PurR-regulated permease PerM
MDPGTRRRTLFLVVSAALFVAVVIAAREVMLPFILAIVIAYVLTPLVAAVERRNVCWARSAVSAP